MADFQIIHDEARGKTSAGRKVWTFTVDGTPSLYWCPTRPAVERVISRLKMGRSREAFGGAAVVAGDRVIGTAGPGSGRGSVTSRAPATPTHTVTMGSGRTKQRDNPSTWHYSLDGTECSESFASEAEARSACAIRAFMTRGKLGRIAEAQSALEARHPGKTCKVYVCPQRHRIVGEVDGKEVHVGFDPDKGVVFKGP